MSTIIFFVDELRDYGKRNKKKLWCHLWTPNGTDEDLDKFAANLGLKKEWAHESKGLIGRFYHYDLVERKRDKALLNGALPKSLSEYILEMKNGNWN